MAMDYSNKTSDTSKKVMDRIMNENRWAMPVHEQAKQSSTPMRTFGLIIAILVLVGISVSFIFINPTAKNNTIETTHAVDVVTTIKSTDFARSFSNLDFLFIQEGTVASIGEPHIYQPNDKRRNEVQLFWMISILGISMITLFMSWLSREDNNHT